jgi:Domain of unknown function (DUF4377)
MSFLVAVSLSAALSSCEPTGLDLLDLYVGPEKATCYGPFERTCLLVREDPSAEWELFYDDIRGFEWEPGYEWKLRVSRGRISKPLQDQSAYTWDLIAVISKTRVAASGSRGDARGRHRAIAG